MTAATSERRARLAALVNGALVFGVPTALMLVVLATIPWPPEIAAFRPSPIDVALETLLYGLLYAALGLVTAWRTQVHALRYQSGASRGWQGVAEAALVGFTLALLYLSRGIITRPSEAPPYVIVYGGAAAILGAIVGLLLRTSATLVMRSRGAKT
jgi:hypothetical protein